MKGGKDAGRWGERDGMGWREHVRTAYAFVLDCVRACLPQARRFNR